ncbi:MAG: hypothetical protein DWQ04_08910 [Chloroflexi bacterium]|nr:MAG: hypothetical protein DWQ04_08910 [Chloroflexota bacterium]
MFASVLGRYDIVGTTVKQPEKLPQHLLVDEKHARFQGQKAYIATTIANDCVLGASVSLGSVQRQKSGILFLDKPQVARTSQNADGATSAAGIA